MNQSLERSTIVVGVDFSDTSLLALRAAVQAAAQSTARTELHFVHVLPLLADPISLGPYVSSLQATMQGATADILKQLAEASEDAGAPPEKTFHHVRIGEPARELVQVASDLGADLVVVGTQGRTGIERMLLGSVAERVVRTAPCQVLTVKPKSVAPAVYIEPPCPDCVAVRESTNRARIWCSRHAEHHARAHTYHSSSDTYGIGAQTFRGFETP